MATVTSSSFVVAIVQLLVIVELATASQDGMQKCDGSPMCVFPNETTTMSSGIEWVSNITAAVDSRTSALLTWNPITSDPLPSYTVVYWIQDDLDNQNMTTTPINETNFHLEGLKRNTSYCALVCNTTDETVFLSSQNIMRTKNCGYCSTCFTTPVLNFTLVHYEAMGDVDLFSCAASGCPSPHGIKWTIPMIGTGKRLQISNDSVHGVYLKVVVHPDNNSIEGKLKAPEGFSLLSSGLECTVVSDVLNVTAGREQFTGEPRQPLNPKKDTSSLSVEEYIATIVSIVGFIVLVIAIAITVYIIYRCRRHHGNKIMDRQSTNTNEIRERGLSQQRVSDPNPYIRYADTEARKTESIRIRSSLSNNMIIPSSRVKISKVIGQGEFGVVYKGMLRSARNSSTEVIAVKTLKGIFTTDSDIKSVTDEILKMEHFNHPNVMSLIGVCMSEETGTGGPSIIMPYMAKGSLLNYLRKESETLKPSASVDITQIQSVQKLLIKICLQISKGMEYLAGLKFVHRDLAARNCMIGHDGMIKVGDFGLAEDVYERSYFRQTPDEPGGASGASKSVKFPLKWMALESIKTGVFSEKTDVWSFGVTCWEVFTGGEIPYPGVHPQQVIRLLEDEERLDKPRNAACSDDMYDLMQTCWNSKPIIRPTFSQIVVMLGDQLEDMAGYLDLNIVAASDITHEPISQRRRRWHSCIEPPTVGLYSIEEDKET